MKKGFHAVLFHGLYKPEQAHCLRHPYLYISTEEFDQIVGLLHQEGFNFISQLDLMSGKIDGCRNVMLTFDDGYFNNSYALPILEKYKVPALFFMVMDQIQQNHAFWWDIYLTQDNGRSDFQDLYFQFQGLKLQRYEDIEAGIIARFGEGALHIPTDIMRPFTLEEARKFAKHPYVAIGAHSRYHDNLSLLGGKELEENLRVSKSFLEELAGSSVGLISYPFGFFNEEVVKMSEYLGYSYGMTTKLGFNDISLLSERHDQLRLNRDVFPIPQDSRSVLNQVRDFIKAIA